jgi:hypothetical protein
LAGSQAALSPIADTGGDVRYHLTRQGLATHQPIYPLDGRRCRGGNGWSVGRGGPVVLGKKQHYEFDGIKPIRRPIVVGHVVLLGQLLRFR